MWRGLGLSWALNHLGRHEAALEAAEEAVRLYRELAQDRPDAFTPNLAVSLSVRADCLESLGRVELALADSREAIVVLRPIFLQVPQAVIRLMVPMYRRYSVRCNELALAPDRELLAPIEEALQLMEEPREGS